MLLRGIARESGGWTRCFYAHWSRKLQSQWPAVPQGAALLARSLALGALAGVRLDLVGGEGSLRGAGAAVGSPPRDGQAVARAESRQVNARNALEVSGALGGRAQLKPKVRR